MRRIFYFVTLLLVAIACEKEVEFSCRVVESEVENITETSATLTATVHATDYSLINRIAFIVGSNSDNMDIYPTNIGRMVELELDDLKPATAYQYNIVVYANGDSWILEGGNFATLSVNNEPEPEPEPEPEEPEIVEVPEIYLETIRPKLEKFPDLIEGIDDKNDIEEMFNSYLIWQERNLIEPIAIGQNCKTVFVFNPIIQKIEE
ncbi:MAG: hypothetical protein J6Q21_03245, partial [Alistipes sp.]|nr:hypothetical protein [Alistipes sp.]